MPSASIKLETKPSPPAEINHQPAAVVITAPHQPHQPEPPIRQVLVLIEHKIRNLEKRKGKLDSYKDSQKSGKDLTSDQLIAVSKYDEVTHLLEFAREFVKQINSILTASEKDQKKIARREAAHRTQQDIGKVREVFVFQNILEQLKIFEIRQDFINGTNGAIRLEDQDFELLDKLLIDVTPIRGENDDAKKFAATAQKSAEIMFHVVDGRTKPYHGEITYEKVRTLIQSIISSEYFDRQPEIVEEEKPVNGIESDENTNDTVVELLNMDEQNGQAKFEGSDDLVKDDGLNESLLNSVDSGTISEAPAPASVPVPSFPATAIPIESTQTLSTQAQVPIQQIVATPVAGVIPVPANQIPPHIGPTTVRAVEQAYFKQHQYLQQIRPIAEVIGTGSFYFLQDSELDSPDPFPNVGFQPASIINNNIQHSPTGPQQQPPPPQQQQSPQHPTSQQQQAIHVTQQQQSAPPNQIPNKAQLPPQQQLINASIQTQTFTNQNFKTIVPTQQQPTVVPYGQIKQSDINPAHIPGFATANQIPVTLSPAPQLHQNPQQNPVHIIAPAPAAVPIPGFVSPQQFVAPNNISPQIINHPQQQSQPPQQPKDVQQPLIVGETKKIVEETPPPKIENWNPNDANPQKDTSNEWQEVSKNDRRDDKDMSNTWNEQNTDNSGYNNRNMSRNVRSGGNIQSRQGGPRGPPPSSNPNGTYHPRSQNTFQSGQTQSTGRPSGNNNNGNTYFRNNDNYYQVQNGGGSNGNFLNARQDNGYNNGQYKPRPHIGGGGSAGGGNMRGNGNPTAGGGQMRNNTGGSNMMDRNNPPQHVPRTNSQNPGGNMNNANRGGNPGGPNMRSSQRSGGGNPGGPSANYGGNTRPGPPPNSNQNSRTSQGINV